MDPHHHGVVHGGSYRGWAVDSWGDSLYISADNSISKRRMLNCPMDLTRMDPETSRLLSVVARETLTRISQFMGYVHEHRDGPSGGSHHLFVYHLVQAMGWFRMSYAKVQPGLLETVSGHWLNSRFCWARVYCDDCRLLVWLLLLEKETNVYAHCHGILALSHQWGWSWFPKVFETIVIWEKKRNSGSLDLWKFLLGFIFWNLDSKSFLQRGYWCSNKG